MERWPSLRYDEWKQTLHTVHLWTQIVGKIRLQLEYAVNHWWHVALYVTPHGLTTSAMPYPGGRSLTIDFDFFDHRLRIAGCDGERSEFGLEPMTVADFYARVMRELHALGFDVRINKTPNEVSDPIRFDRDTVHASYDKAYVERFQRVLLQADRLCKAFRGQFLGKASPVHFFWGSFDLAETRFSGRTAPQHPGGIPGLPDSVTREAYSREEQSVGFWPGSEGIDAAFYAYAYPEPPGYANARILPENAAWNASLHEFVLPYEAVRTAPNRDAAVLDFFSSTYAAAADLAGWDRVSLERSAT
jgi:Family of unknown function (DUF5996)